MVQSAFKKTDHRHFYFGMAHCFELRLSKMANYVIILWSMRKNNQLWVFSNYMADTVVYGHTRVVRNGKYITLDGVVPHPLKGVM